VDGLRRRPGQITFEWLEGGYFLTQRVDLDHGGHRVRGLEVIGRERGFGAEPSEEIRSRFYSSEGETLDYVYELDGDRLMIWAGEKGSPAYYRGHFTDGGDILTGAWVGRTAVTSSPARRSADEHARTSQTRGQVRRSNCGEVPTQVSMRRLL
jgi:hypothetical protein